MASEVISYRLSQAEIEALSALQKPEDKSLNQTAARLLRERLADNNPDLYTDASTSVSTVDINELKSAILVEVNQKLAELREEILGKIDQSI